eukprot:883918-Rhodomonas_salina.1
MQDSAERTDTRPAAYSTEVKIALMKSTWQRRVLGQSRTGCPMSEAPLGMEPSPRSRRWKIKP